jgi:hypothetical protein
MERLHAKIDVDSISIFKIFLEEDNSMHVLCHFCLLLIDLLVESRYSIGLSAHLLITPLSCQHKI